MTINDDVYGVQTIDDPVVLELLETPAMQRLKQIHQYGAYYKNQPKWKGSRYDHSVGVYLLLRSYGAPREECIYGLLHDVGHMAFSHVADFVFDRTLEQDVGDKATEAYVMGRTQIPALLQKNGISAQTVLSKDHFPLAERSAPDLCADRIDYTFRDGLAFGIIQKEDIGRYLEHLKADGDYWVFDDLAVARDYAEDVYMMVESFWTPAWGVFMYILMAKAIRRGFDLGVITKDDLWEDDETVWKKLQTGDACILSLLNQVESMNFEKIIAASGSGEIQRKVKCRLQNPLMKQEGRIMRATDKFPDLRERFRVLKEKYEEPFAYPEWLVNDMGIK